MQHINMNITTHFDLYIALAWPIYLERFGRILDKGALITLTTLHCRQMADGRVPGLELTATATYFPGALHNHLAVYFASLFGTCLSSASH